MLAHASALFFINHTALPQKSGATGLIPFLSFDLPAPLACLWLRLTV